MTAIATKYPFVGYIETRQGGRQENQDNAGFVDTPIGLLLVVCDGMGGGPGGRTASRMAVDQILTTLEEVADHTNNADALRFAIEKANELLFAESAEKEQLRGMGTTVAAIIIGEDAATVAHVGDSRIYQLRKGRIIYRSKDHSVVAALVEEGRLTEEEARNHPQSNIVTKALGVRPSIDIDIEELAFQRGDRFVLCTDGIWGAQPQEKLLETLSRPMGIAELTHLVAEETDKLGRNAGGGHDNLTLAILDASFASATKGNSVKTFQPKQLETENKHQEEKPVRTSLWWAISIILTVIIVTVFCFYLFNMDKKQEQENELTIGPTVTTIGRQGNHVSDSGYLAIHEKSNEPAASTNNSPDKVQNDKENELNPFNSEINSKFVNKQINTALEYLDSLKRIRGKQAKEKKSDYVKKVITPQIQKIGEQIGNRQKVEEVMKMLKDRKTTSCSIKGDPTKEGNNHIDSIKEKVKKLKANGNN